MLLNIKNDKRKAYQVQNCMNQSTHVLIQLISNKKLKHKPCNNISYTTKGQIKLGKDMALTKNIPITHLHISKKHAYLSFKRNKQKKIY